MSKWVRIEKGKVFEIIPEDATLPSIEYWYDAEFAAQCIEAPDEVQQNWSYDGTNFSAPIIDKPSFELLYTIAKGRINADCSKLIVNGFVSSLHYGESRNYIMDENKQSQMETLAIRLSSNLISSALWKSSNLDSDICDVWSKANFLQFYADFNTYKTSLILKSDILCDRLKTLTTEEEMEKVTMASELTASESTIMQSRLNAMIGSS
jgi:hypothetical protein